MDPDDLLLIRELERGLPLVPEPFEAIGSRLGIPGAEVIARIQALLRAGVIRKFRARFDQRKAGIVANALVAWNPQGHPNGTGPLLASFPGVTHCYERLPVPGRWEYRFYTVHHGYTRGEVLEQVRMMADRTGIADYSPIFSIREFRREPGGTCIAGDTGGGR